MEQAEIPGVVLLIVAYAFIGMIITATRLPRTVKGLVWLGLGLRVVGAVGRMSIAADAHVYFDAGVLYSEYLARFDPTPLFDKGLWTRPQQILPGTNFAAFFTGVVVAAIGRSWFGAFLAFGLISFLGLLAYARGFRKAFPQADLTRYWAWLLLFPSLWFWPSSIGKEALVMFGLGVATLGYVGSGRRTNWPVLGIGTLLVAMIRPEVAAVLVLAVTVSYWVDFDRWTATRMLQGVFMAVVGLVAIWYAMAQTEAGGLNPTEVEALVAYNAAQAAQGGSAIGTTGIGLLAVPVAIMNVLFRPFLWEVHNMAAAFSAVEIAAMWILIWLRRHQLGIVLKAWRRHRVLRFAMPFLLFYVAALGMNLSNLGIIARQRSLIFPVLFMVFEAGSRRVRARRRKGAGEPVMQARAAPSPAGVSS